MRCKIVSLLALFVALLSLASAGTKAKADGFYTYAITGVQDSASDYCITFGGPYDSSQAQYSQSSITHYDCLTGNSYAGFIVKVVKKSASVMTVFSSGYMSDGKLAFGQDDIDTDGSNHPHVLDLLTGQELFNVRGDMGSPVLWGWQYVW